MKARITKIEKGVFIVEYKTSLWGDWKMLDKPFATKTKAELFIINKGWEIDKGEQKVSGGAL